MNLFQGCKVILIYSYKVILNYSYKVILIYSYKVILIYSYKVILIFCMDEQAECECGMESNETFSRHKYTKYWPQRCSPE